jgi:hypothetical protein
MQEITVLKQRFSACSLSLAFVWTLALAPAAMASRH